MITFEVDTIYSIEPKLSAGSAGKNGMELRVQMNEMQINNLFCSLMEQFGDEMIARICMDVAEISKQEDKP